MITVDSAPATSPQSDVRSLPDVRAFSSGTFAAQLSNFGIQVTLPLVVLSLTHSIKAVAGVTAFVGVADSIGSFFGGWLTDRIRPRIVIYASNVARAVSLAVIPALSLTGGLSLSIVTAVFVCDGLMRGITESASYTYVVLLAGSDKKLLDHVNSRYATAFEAGAVLGPLAAGGVLWLLGAASTNWAIPLGFALAALFLYFMPNETRTSPKPGNPVQAVRALVAHPWLTVVLLEIVMLTLYPLRNALPAVYATVLFNNPKLTAWLVPMFGIGGWIGARLYRRVRDRHVSTVAWILFGALGAVVLAVAWVGSNFIWTAAAILIFSVANMAARLSAQSEFMSRLPVEQAGSITGLERTLVKLMAMSVKAVPAMAMAFTTPSGSFRVIGLALGVMAVLQVATARFASRLRW